MCVRLMRTLFVVISLVLFSIAFYFAKEGPFAANGMVGDGVQSAAIVVAGLASLGFAISGGLALLAAAVMKKEALSCDTTNAGPANSAR